MHDVRKIQKVQRVQNNAARTVLQSSKRSYDKLLLHQLHWLLVQQRITYKLAVLAYEVWSTSTPVYVLYERITREREREREIYSYKSIGKPRQKPVSAKVYCR